MKRCVDCMHCRPVDHQPKLYLCGHPELLEHPVEDHPHVLCLTARSEPSLGSPAGSAFCGVAATRFEELPKERIASFLKFLSWVIGWRHEPV